MRDGEVRTDTIARADLPAAPAPGAGHWEAAARLLGPSSDDPWADGWRLNAPPVRRVRLREEERAIAVVEAGRTTSDGPEAVRDGDVVHVDVEGQSVEIVWPNRRRFGRGESARDVAGDSSED